MSTVLSPARGQARGGRVRVQVLYAAPSWKSEELQLKSEGLELWRVISAKIRALVFVHDFA